MTAMLIPCFFEGRERPSVYVWLRRWPAAVACC